jgi:hypothetical protein
MTVYRREGEDPRQAWNELVRQINECLGVEIDTLPPGSVWKRSHLQEVVDALAECEEIDMPELWSGKTVNEIVDLIEEGTCCCEEEDRETPPSFNNFAPPDGSGYRLFQTVSGEGTWAMFDWAGWVMRGVEPLSVELIDCPGEDPIERRTGGRGWVGRQFVGWEMWMYTDRTGPSLPIRTGGIVDGYIDIGEGEWRPEQECGEPLPGGTPLGEEDPDWRFRYSTNFTGTGFELLDKDGGFVANLPSLGGFGDGPFLPGIPSSPYVVQTATSGEIHERFFFLRLLCE